MIVLDTHVWLWWLAAPGRLSPRVAEAIDGSDEVGISAISCWEVAMLAARGRIRLDRDVPVWVRQALHRERVRELPLGADVALAAALLGDGLAGDPADRLIYATARAHRATLATRDVRLRAFDPARTVW